MELPESGVLGTLRMSVQTRESPPWREKLDHLLVEEAGTVVARRWDELLPFVTCPGRMVVSPSGRTVLGLLPPGRTYPLPASQTLVLLDLAGEKVIETGYTQVIAPPDENGPSDQRGLAWAMAADDEAFAVAVIEQRGGAHATDATLTVVNTADLRSRVSRVFSGHSSWIMSGTDAHLQWSPDGRYLAWQVREPHERWGVQTYDSLLILDARTLDTVQRHRRTWLMGSQSWSPDGEILAVNAFHSPRLLHLADEGLEALPWMKDRVDNPPRGPQLLGLLSGRRGLVLPLSRKRARFLVADLATGKGPTGGAFAVAHWPIYPTVSRGWERLAAASAP